jgi:hypothetical protein
MYWVSIYGDTKCQLATNQSPTLSSNWPPTNQSPTLSSNWPPTLSSNWSPTMSSNWPPTGHQPATNWPPTLSSNWPPTLLLTAAVNLLTAAAPYITHYVK